MHLLFEGFRFSFLVVLLSHHIPALQDVSKSALEFCLTVRTPQGMILLDLIRRFFQASKASRGRCLKLVRPLWSDHAALSSDRGLDVSRPDHERKLNFEKNDVHMTVLGARDKESQ